MVAAFPDELYSIVCKFFLPILLSKIFGNMLGITVGETDFKLVFLALQL